MSKRLLPLIPPGLAVVQVLPASDRVTIVAQPRSPTGTCPYCGALSHSVHSRYERHLGDLVRPGLGFSSLRTARRTLAGFEAMAMIRKGQVHNVGRRDMKAQTTFIAGLFGVAA